MTDEQMKAAVLLEDAGYGVFNKSSVLRTLRMKAIALITSYDQFPETRKQSKEMMAGFFAALSAIPALAKEAAEVRKLWDHEIDTIDAALEAKHRVHLKPNHRKPQRPYLQPRRKSQPSSKRRSIGSGKA